MCKEPPKEGDAIMLAVAKQFDEIKLFAGSAGREPPQTQKRERQKARAGLDGIRRHEAEEQGQSRTKSQQRFCRR